ncbi:anthranilate phosphoribosyltransferase [Kroppenstedtia guangzhouensis]|uniref:Anthranilate phosphoribosyltransferase n=1 Tax=Kroppenstedtia guangzhouensis TaxID=1274356 RepID=A0ABQ1G8A9_9BACL|nr:anthranilate phosphoribosyltransferase [Kroppenstedtia guangzhouensis]GGA38699.1 anthranilate phosphoribosyltransferase [Kroppenstedtia guangzhouensis]
MVERSLAKLMANEDLNRAESETLMGAMMEGKLPPAQVAAVLTALRIKGETVEELAGMAASMRARAQQLTAVPPEAVDTCGTGGDGGKTFNISTAAAIVAAAAGVPVAKHGNRAVSGKSGSADVLEALGVGIQLTLEEAEQTLAETGICFLFAPLFHQAMKQVMPIRKELGFRTCFNLAGPLANPAGVRRQLVGVFDPGLTETLARVLLSLGSERVMVVSGLDGVDEITLTGETQVSEIRDGKVHTYRITPEEVGLKRCHPTELSGGDAVVNARIIREIFQGKPGPRRDVVLANAGAVLTIAGLSGCLQEGIHLARETVDEGRAQAKLEEMAARRGAEVSHVS